MKSPIDQKPLPNPGESTERRIGEVFEQVTPYVMVAAFLVAIAILEVVRWYNHRPPSPILFTIAALVAVAVAALKIIPARRKALSLRQGADGEKAVGQILDQLVAIGAKVFHDVPGDGFNVDHVVVHAAGIFVIETKTLSKPDRGAVKLIFNGATILRNGHELPRNPVPQVLAARRYVTERLKATTGRQFPAYAVLLFPGWYVSTVAEAKRSDVWALNPKMLGAFIEDSATVLRPEDVELCADRLSMLSRDGAARR